MPKKSLNMEHQPVFNLDRRCSAAMRRITAFVDERVAAEKARMAAEFGQQRRNAEAKPLTDLELLKAVHTRAREFSTYGLLRAAYDLGRNADEKGGA